MIEYDYERDLNNLMAAIDRLDITWLVAQDNDRQTWSAYNNRYWPTIYLIDKRGNIRYTHIGEGRYAETNATIRDLLAEDYPGVAGRQECHPYRISQVPHVGTPFLASEGEACEISFQGSQSAIGIGRSSQGSCS